MSLTRRAQSWTAGDATAAIRYGVGAALALGAIALTAVVSPLGEGSALMLAVAGVAVSAVFGGAGPGLLTVALVTASSSAAAWPLRADDFERIAIFALVGAVVARAAGWSRARSRDAVAARREAGQRIRGRLGALRAITRAMDEGVYALDRAGRITFLNAAAERMLGYRQAELVGKTVKEALRCSRIAGSCSGKRCRLLEVMATGEPYRGADDLLTRKDGSCFPVRYSSAPIARGGEIVGAVVVFQDVAVEQRAELRDRFLAAATEQLQASIDEDETLARVARIALPFLGDWCMVVLVDEDGSPRRVAVEATDPGHAAAARDMLRHYPIDLQAEHGAGRVLRTGAPELIPEVRDFVGTAGVTVRTRAELLERMGLRSFMAVPLRARGRTLGVIDFATTSSRRFGPEDLATASELARRCALAVDNAQLHRQAREAVRAREDALAIVSHDLKNPLGAIRMAAEVIAKTLGAGAPEAARRATDLVLRVCGRMDRLIGDLVDLAAVDAGCLSVVREPVRAAELLAEAREAVRALASERGVEVGAAAGPGAWVDADRDRVVQVLVNLLSNAIKVTSRGGRVELRHRARRGEVVFSVVDGGPGIARRDQARIFDRYWRGADYRGTGLGLSIVRGIVEAHGGRVWVVSRPGRGAIFRFTLAEHVAGARRSDWGAAVAR